MFSTSKAHARESFKSTTSEPVALEKPQTRSRHLMRLRTHQVVKEPNLPRLKPGGGIRSWSDLTPRHLVRTFGYKCLSHLALGHSTGCILAGGSSLSTRPAIFSSLVVLAGFSGLSLVQRPTATAVFFCRASPACLLAACGDEGS